MLGFVYPQIQTRNLKLIVLTSTLRMYIHFKANKPEMRVVLTFKSEAFTEILQCDVMHCSAMFVLLAL